jgi:hypothetical protein
MSVQLRQSLHRTVVNVHHRSDGAQCTVFVQQRRSRRLRLMVDCASPYEHDRTHPNANPSSQKVETPWNAISRSVRHSAFKPALLRAPGCGTASCTVQTARFDCLRKRPDFSTWPTSPTLLSPPRHSPHPHLPPARLWRLPTPRLMARPFPCPRRRPRPPMSCPPWRRFGQRVSGGTVTPIGAVLRTLGSRRVPTSTAFFPAAPRPLGCRFNRGGSAVRAPRVSWPHRISRAALRPYQELSCPLTWLAGDS